MVEVLCSRSSALIFAGISMNFPQDRSSQTKIHLNLISGDKKRICCANFNGTFPIRLKKKQGENCAKTSKTGSLFFLEGGGIDFQNWQQFLQVITCFQMFLGTFRSFAAMRQANSIAYYFYWYTYMVLFRDLAKRFYLLDEFSF